MKYLIWGLLFVLCASAQRAQKYVSNTDGRGIGIYECSEETDGAIKMPFSEVCTEKIRCGPISPRKDEYIECGGIIALCGDSTYGWGSMKVRMVEQTFLHIDGVVNRVAEYSIVQEPGEQWNPFKWYNFQNGVVFEQAKALAEVCAKN